MLIFYFDTSALVKRYYPETGSEVVDKIFEKKAECDFAISPLTLVEFAVALSAKRKRGEISERGLKEAFGKFVQEITLYFTVKSVEDELFRNAIPLALKHSLPSSDCLQLVTVLDLKKIVEPVKNKLIFVCSDTDLCKAAGREGLEVFTPEEQGALERFAKLMESG